MNRRRVIFFLLKIGITALLAYNIYQHLFVNNNFSAMWTGMKQQFSSSSVALFILVFLLMFLNWGLEARKWNYLVNKAEKISFAEAMKAIFCGVTVATLTPNRVGEYAGRLLVIRQTNFLRIINITLIGSFAQIVATLVFGTIGLEFFVWQFSGVEKYLQVLIAFLCISFIALVVFLFFNLKVFYLFLSHLKLFGKWRKYFRIWNYYDQRDLIRVLLLSLLRYVVFALQYFFLLKALIHDVPMAQSLLMIMVIYLLQFIIPSIALAEFGIRENLAIYFFGFLGMAATLVASAAFCLWVINLIIPALIGTFFILRINISKTKTYGT